MNARKDEVTRPYTMFIRCLLTCRQLGAQTTGEVRWEKRLGEYMMDKLERLGDLACEKRLDNE